LFNNLKTSNKLIILNVVFIIGFILFAVIAYTTITAIKINGEMYHEIISGKDLVADILPPPEYIIEAYLTALQLSKETDKTKIEALIHDEEQLKINYDTRHDFWVGRLPEGNLKKNMVEDSYKPAIEFFEIFENEFVPAVRSGDEEKANEILTSKLDKLYLEHRLAIDQVVVLANNENSGIEKTASKMVSSDLIILGILVIVVLFTVIIFCVVMIRNEKLKNMSFLDGLTGIANRRYFDQKLLQEIRRARRDKNPLSLIMIDIDYFKAFNDAYGHLEGDDCLKLVASTLKNTLRRPGDFLARYGGEEFVVILPNTDDAGSAIIAEKLRASIERLDIAHVSSLCADYVTVSLGIVTRFSKQTETPDNLILAADRALYRSKNEGRNRISVEQLV